MPAHSGFGPKREVAITAQDETRPALYSGASALIVHERSAAAEYWRPLLLRRSMLA